jgi:hypothetical protein
VKASTTLAAGEEMGGLKLEARADSSGLANLSRLRERACSRCPLWPTCPSPRSRQGTASPLEEVRPVGNPPSALQDAPSTTK